MKITVLSAVCLSLASASAAQSLRFDDVVRNLRHPDPKTRLSAVRLLRDAKYPEAIAPIAPLVADPVDEVQFEAIAAELSFFLGDQIKARRMVGLVVERRHSAVAEAAFEMGPAVVWPRRVPPELVSSLLTAVDDENPRVRLESIYALGVVARPPFPAEQSPRLIKALDHYDPEIRAAAGRVIGRLRLADAGEALIKAVNDSHPDVRYAAMRALGALKEQRAIGSLTEQFDFYKKGEGAWSALDALAQIAAPASVPLFKEHLADKDPYLRRAAAEGLGRTGDKTALETLERGATTDDAEMVRVAMAFALQKLGRTNYTARIIDALRSSKVEAQARQYLIELGPSVTPPLFSRLQDPDPDIRQAVAEVLGVIGGDGALPALQTATKDPDAAVANAAKRAIERIKTLRDSSAHLL